jgi:hypothetical protein
MTYKAIDVLCVSVFTIMFNDLYKLSNYSDGYWVAYDLCMELDSGSIDADYCYIPFWLTCLHASFEYSIQYNSMIGKRRVSYWDYTDCSWVTEQCLSNGLGR